jgi:glutaconate CoA-transferase subunit B
VSLHPGVTLDQVRQQVGWELRTGPQVSDTEPPTDLELRLLREQMDPTDIDRA